MAILAYVRCQNMRCTLTGCLNAVMAADAVASNIQVIEVRRKPAGCCMTVIALFATRYVCCVLTGRDNAIVTRATGAQHLCVVDVEYWFERDRAVAVLADVCCSDMDRASTCCGYAVMTRDTVSYNPNVVEYGRLPRGDTVAVIALVARRNMRWCLAGRRDAIVTSVAAASD